MSPLLPTSTGITWPPKVLEADCEFLNSYISSSMIAFYVRHVVNYFSAGLAVEWSTLAPLTSFIKENLDKTRQVPVLVVTGDADEVHGPQHYNMQLTEIAMRANFSNVEWIRMERANHQLSHQRKEVGFSIVSSSLLLLLLPLYLISFFIFLFQFSHVHVPI